LRLRELKEIMKIGCTSELSVVVPTLKGRDNIGPLIELLDAALVGIAWEVIFVDDDSRDDTAPRLIFCRSRSPNQ
jgi:dolichol-phosphate mannosyltransferase